MKVELNSKTKATGFYLIFYLDYYYSLKIYLGLAMLLKFVVTRIGSGLAWELQQRISYWQIDGNLRVTYIIV